MSVSVKIFVCGIIQGYRVLGEDGIIDDDLVVGICLHDVVEYNPDFLERFLETYRDDLGAESHEMECEDLRIQIAEAQALFEIGDILPVFIAVLGEIIGHVPPESFVLDREYPQREIRDVESGPFQERFQTYGSHGVVPLPKVDASVIVKIGIGELHRLPHPQRDGAFQRERGRHVQRDPACWAYGAVPGQ